MQQERIQQRNVKEMAVPSSRTQEQIAEVIPQERVSACIGEQIPRTSVLFCTASFTIPVLKIHCSKMQPNIAKALQFLHCIKYFF